jgi:glycosyltransferase involved in cell wall biosynthesis
MMKVGVVVIGRNEGDRLKRCLESLEGVAAKLVYVDSGSTDDSVNLARRLGAKVISLDISIPFTAARARNAGFDELCRQHPQDITYVQFVDGDCEILDGWLDVAKGYLEKHSDVAAVCGRLRERYPHASVYNMLCDIEWNTPVGETKACGGIVIIRVDVYREALGFNPDVIAGEEPELCLRIREKGWKIVRLNQDMGLHDASITRFNQWWKRNVRAGYAYALGADMHGAAPEFHRVRETKRIWLWGFWLPISIILIGFIEPMYLNLFLLYPLQIARIKYKNTQIEKNGWLYAFFVTIGKFPEVQGQLKFLLDRLMRKKNSIIEYKV